MTERQQSAQGPGEILPLLASAWFYGGFKAETRNERLMQAIMEREGWWPFAAEDELIAALEAAACA